MLEESEKTPVLIMIASKDIEEEDLFDAKSIGIPNGSRTRV